MAAQDLQISRSHSIGIPGIPQQTVDAAETGPFALVTDVMRRRWLLLLLSLGISLFAAFMLSKEYYEETYTGTMTISRQPLPSSAESVYSSPEPGAAAAILRTHDLLKGPVEEYGLESVFFLRDELIVKANSDSNTIIVNLALSNRDNVVNLLNGLGAALCEELAKRRKDSLLAHVNYQTQLEMNALGAVEKARSALAGYDENVQGAEAAAESALRKLDTLRRKLELSDASLEQARFRSEQLDRELSQADSDAAAVVEQFRLEILKERKRQCESLGQSLPTKTKTRLKHDELVSRDLLAQLTDLENFLHGGRVSKADQADETQISDDNVRADGVATDGNQSVNASEPRAGTQPKSDETREEDSPVAGQLLADWIGQVQSIGLDEIGGFDPQAVIVVEKAVRDLASIEREQRRLNLSSLGVAAEIAHYIKKGVEASKDIDDQKSDSAVERGDQLELEADLALKERHYLRLNAQVEQLNEVRECKIAGYVVSAEAIDDTIEVKSNRVKLFLFCLFGFGLILLIPIVAMETFHETEAPVTVLSRRLGLPALGISTQVTSAKSKPALISQIPNQEMRMIALRIQQSVTRAKGRVVLISALDHNEGVVGLMGSLAKCLAAREETVLVVQTLPSRQSSQNNDGTRPVQHGVAEYISGQFDDVSELIQETPVSGIHYLPGGCNGHTSEAMASSRLTRLINQCRERYSMVLLAGPSSLYPADLQMLAARADGIVFTVTRRSVNGGGFGNEVIADLLELGAPVLGLAAQPPSRRTTKSKAQVNSQNA